METIVGPSQVPGAGFAAALLMNLVAISLFVFGVYYRRHRRRDMAMVFWFFNLCLFVAVVVIQATEAGAALGFGLFAILSIIRLRSETFTNVEIGYFFGALVLGLVNGIGTGDLRFVAALDALIVASMLVLDHERTFPAVQRQQVTFDRVVCDPVELSDAIGLRLGLAVRSVRVVSIDLIKESMELEVTSSEPVGIHSALAEVSR